MVRRRHATLVALLGLGAAACGGAQRIPLEAFHADQRVDPAQYVDVDEVVLLDRQELTFSFNVKQWRPYAELIHHRRVQVLQEGGLRWRKVFIPYDQTSGLLAITARLHKADGSMRDLGAVDSLDYNRFAPSHPAAVLYNAPAAKVFAVPELEVGDVIEYAYRRVIKDASWVEPLRFGGPAPIVHAEASVIYPDGFDVAYRVHVEGRPVDHKPQRFPQRVRGDPERSETEGVPGTKLLWVFEQVPALYPEPFRPADEALARQVHLQFRRFHYNQRAFEGFNGWHDVARWYGRLIGETDAPSAAGAKVLAEIGATPSVPKARRVELINRFVAETLVPIRFDGSLAALVAHRPASVLAAKTGDAKDLASATLSMLRGAQVEAFPVLCSRRGTRAVSPDLPTPEAFNSAVVAIAQGGTYTFLAPDGFGLPPGRIPWRVQGTRALLIRPSGAELITLPEDAASDNLRNIDIRLELQRDGSASGTAILKLFGQDAQALRLALEGAEEQERLAAAQGFLLGEGSKLTVTGVEARWVDDALRLVMPLRARALAKPSGRDLRFSITDLLGHPEGYLWRERRRADLDLGFRLTERASVAVRMPNGMGLGSRPDERRQGCAVVSIEDRIAAADGQAWLLRERTVQQAQVPADGYTALRNFYQALWRHQEQVFEVVPGGDRGRDYQGEPF